MTTVRLRTAGSDFVDGSGSVVRLRGVGLGGWLNMENFITGYSANESLMRSTVRAVLGEESAELFFDRLLTVFFGDADAALLAEQGLNCVRLPVNYRHFEDDAKPFVIKEDGFAHLDRVIDDCARHGIYTVVDLHALPGSQNHHWHSDNPTHLPMFWTHAHFQDRVVNLWEVIADRYKDNPWVAGYNPINEPADESRAVLGPYYTRLCNAIRAVDPDHILFLDGNTYSTEFDVFGEPADNTVYVCHDYVAAGLGRADYPGREHTAHKFLERSEYARRTGTPIWVGEFGPIYTGDPDVDTQRRAILDHQLEIYREHGASWSIWTYKDLGPQGLVTVRPDSPYALRFGEFIAKKNRLAADQWGSDGEGVVEATRPFQELIAREFPTFDPYPWGRWDWVRTLLLNIAVAQPLAYEYAELFRGLGPAELVALADSFALANCTRRTTLLEQLRRG
jgi:endoglucanase